jgi:hypothetical protein
MWTNRVTGQAWFFHGMYVNYMGMPADVNDRPKELDISNKTAFADRFEYEIKLDKEDIILILKDESRERSKYKLTQPVEFQLTLTDVIGGVLILHR